MPIYEYECRKCKHQFEYLVLHSTPPPSCPKCRRKDLKQLISMCSVSSEATRGANLKSARKKASAVQKDQAHEEHKHAHHDD